MNKFNWKVFALSIMMATSTVNTFAQETSSVEKDNVSPQYIVTQGEDFKGYIYVQAHYPATKDSKEHYETAYCYLYLNFVKVNTIETAKFDCIIIRPNNLRGLHLQDECPAANWHQAMASYAMGFFPNSDHITISFGDNEYKKAINN